MMKVGIITFHFPYNCGAVLQCVALQKALEKKNNEVIIINYKPWYHQNRYTPKKNPMQHAKQRYAKATGSKIRKLYVAAKGYYRIIRSWKHAKSKQLQDNKFNGFVDKYLHTSSVYRTLVKLQNKAPRCDLYISGSDQLWNAHITDGRLDEAYFMKFGSAEAGRITYAVGADFSEINNYEEILPDLLKDIDCIALRERKCYDIIQSCAPDKEIVITIDPTFLLEKEEYDFYMTAEVLETEPFIFTYTMPNDTQTEVYRAAKLLSEKTGLKIIDASGQPMKANEVIEDHRLCGPDEFLWYMKNAQFVLTNSFHGTAFSVIMEKRFCVIPHSQTGNRARELLDKMELTDRCVYTGDEVMDVIRKDVDYDSVKKLRQDLKTDSLAYLDKCIAEYGYKRQ